MGMECVCASLRFLFKEPIFHSGENKVERELVLYIYTEIVYFGGIDRHTYSLSVCFFIPLY